MNDPLLLKRVSRLYSAWQKDPRFNVSCLTEKSVLDVYVESSNYWGKPIELLVEEDELATFGCVDLFN